MIVETLKRHRYAGTMRERGTEYSIDKIKHVKLLMAVGRIKIIENEKSQPEKKIEKPKEKVVVKTKTKIQKVNKAKSSFYSRKDMTAADNKSVDKKKKTRISK